MHTLQQLRSGELAGATRLDLSCGLREFPREIFELADSLEVLNLSGNALDSLPDDLGRLHRLKVLFCSANDFDELPAAVGDCPALSMVGFDDHGLAVEEAVELGDAAPHGDPTVGQRPLVGMQVRADRRMDAVGADQHIGTERLGLAVSVAGADQHAAVALLDTLHAETGAYRLLAEALAHRGEQDRPTCWR